MYTNILVVLLKNGSTHQIIRKEEENESVIALKKDKKHGKNYKICINDCWIILILYKKIIMN